MGTAKLTSKGQITIPVQVRKKLGIETGDRVDFIEESGRIIITPVTQDASKLKGIIKKPKKPVSIDKMNKAIREKGGKG